jgi:hypothetical protein
MVAGLFYLGSGIGLAVGIFIQRLCRASKDRLRRREHRGRNDGAAP